MSVTLLGWVGVHHPVMKEARQVKTTSPGDAPPIVSGPTYLLPEAYPKQALIRSDPRIFRGPRVSISSARS